MYNLVRLIIGCIIFACSMIAVKKSKAVNKRALRLVFAILSVVLTGLLGFFPFENLFVTSDSPKAAYNYYYTFEKSNIDLIVEGDTCDFVVERKNATEKHLIVPKTADGWKVGLSTDIKRIVYKSSEEFLAFVYQYKNANEYFVVILDKDGGKSTISDEYNTQFLSFEVSNDSIGYTPVTYYGHITDFNSQYSVTVDGQKIVLGE